MKDASSNELCVQVDPEKLRLDTSIEDFEAKFREAFDREMTADERRYFNLHKPRANLNRCF